MLWNAHPWLCCPTNFISGLTLSEEKAPGLCEEQERDMFWTIFKRHLRTIQEAIKEEGKVTRILTWYGKCWEGYFNFYHVELWRLHVASRDGHFAAVYHTGLSAQPNASRDSTEKLTVAQSKNMRKLDALHTYNLGMHAILNDSTVDLKPSHWWPYCRTTQSSGWSRNQSWEEKDFQKTLFTLKKFKEQTQLVSGCSVSQAQEHHILSHLKNQAGIWSTSSSPCFRTAAKYPTLTASGFKFPAALHTDHSSGGSFPSRPLWRNHAREADHVNSLSLWMKGMQRGMGMKD